MRSTEICVQASRRRDVRIVAVVHGLRVEQCTERSHLEFEVMYFIAKRFDSMRRIGRWLGKATARHAHRGVGRGRRQDQALLPQEVPSQGPHALLTPLEGGAG